MIKLIKSLFETKKEKKVKELIQVGVKLGCGYQYSNIVARASVYEKDFPITHGGFE